MYLCALNNILSEIMPRQERLHSATGIYHVMLRGINKQDIFEDDEDYIQFLKILNGLVVRHDDDGHVLPAHCTFYAYCLMTNHIHLLMREHDEQIGESVKRIGVAYARYYNRKYERNGHIDYGTGGIITDDDIKERIVDIYGLQTPTELQRLGKKERNTILKQLCEYGANIRQISRVTGISYGVIYAKSGS